MGRVVLLNGPPSSGKTALARALQEELGEPWFHRSLDDFRAGYCDERWRSDDGTLFNRLMAGYLAALRALALEGNHILAEAIITPRRRGAYVQAFQGLDVVLIGVRCPYDVAVEREQRRDDRRHGPIDLPRSAFSAVHTGIAYDLEVDTATGTAQSLAVTLAPRLQGPRCTAFALLAENPPAPP